MPGTPEAERRDPPAERAASVIIPARNEARTIAGLIRAVQEQAPPGWRVEVVLVDVPPLTAVTDAALVALAANLGNLFD